VLRCLVSRFLDGWMDGRGNALDSRSDELLMSATDWRNGIERDGNDIQGCFLRGIGLTIASL
jgi:hypothetical protein